MTTNNDNNSYPCSFCERDEGVLLSLSRYKVISSKDEKYNEEGLYEFNLGSVKSDLEYFYTEKKKYLKEVFPNGYDSKNWQEATPEKIRIHNNKNSLKRARKELKKRLDTHWNTVLSNNKMASREKFEQINKLEFDFVAGGENIVDESFLKQFTEDDINTYALNNPDHQLETIVIQAQGYGLYYTELKELNGIKCPQNYGYDIGLLRSGFIYVFSEHLGSHALEKYEVSERGFLKKVPLIIEKKAPSLKKEPCEITIHQFRALTISIKKAKEANNVWIKYSEVEWTDKIEKKAFDSKFRNDSMTVVNIPKILSSQEQLHVTDVSKFIRTLTSDYDAIKLSEARNDGNLSILDNNNKEIKSTIGEEYTEKYTVFSEEELKKTIDLSDEYEVLIKSLNIHANVVLTDTVGLLMDVGGKMSKEKSRIIDLDSANSELSNEEKTYLTYSSIKNMIDIAMYDQALDEKEHSSIFGVPNLVRNMEEKKKTAQQKQKESEEIIKNAEKSASNVKYKYWGAINPAKYEAAKINLNLREQSINQAIENLGRWYIDLISNEKIVDSFDLNYDQNDIISNVEYLVNATDIIRNSMLSRTVTDYYKNKINGVLDKHNILLKAYALNNQKMLEIVKNQQDLRQILWGDVLTKSKALMDEIAEKGKVAGESLKDKTVGHLDMLLGSSSGAVVSDQYPKLNSVLTHSKSIVPTRLSPVLVLLSGYTQSPIVSVSFTYRDPTSFYKQLSGALVRIYQNTSPDSEKLDERKLVKQMRRLNIFEAYDIKGSIEFNGLFPEYAITRVSGDKHLEKLIAASFAKNMTVKQPLFSENTIFTPVGYNTTQESNSNLKAMTPLSLTLVSSTNGILQVLNLLSLSEVATKNQNFEWKTRIFAAISGTISAIVETSIYTISRIVSQDGSFASWTSSKGKSILENMGRLGAIFGLITASFDVWNGLHSLVVSGDRLEGLVLAGSGFFVFSASWLFFANLTNPIGWALLILGVGLSLALTRIKLDPIEKWLYRSFIGERHMKFFYRPFRTYSEQQAAFAKIIE